MLNAELWKTSGGIYLIRRPTFDATVSRKKLEHYTVAAMAHRRKNVTHASSLQV